MPTITVPLTDWSDTDLRKSKKFKSIANELIALKQQSDLIEARQSELRREMYPVLDGGLDSATKSVAYEGYRLTKIDAGQSTRFSKDKLMQRPIRCSKCKTVNHVTPVDIEACEEKVARKATVQVAKLKDGEGGDD